MSTYRNEIRPQARDRPEASGGRSSYSVKPRRQERSSTVGRRSAINSLSEAKSQKRGRILSQDEADALQSNLLLWMDTGDICVPGYTRLSDNPEIQTGCLRIAELVSSMPIHIYENTPDGDKRVENELSRALDITPNGNMNRSHWIQVNAMNLLLYGRGNAICVPHTRDGYLESMEPISADRVQLSPLPGSFRDYRVLIDGIPHDPAELMHFVYNPDSHYLWKGQGTTVTLKEIAQNLKQAQKTKNAFMSSVWKPSIIVKVDALSDEFSSPAGRQKLVDEYIRPQEPGAPWVIPAEEFSVEQIKPLTLSDLAISDSVSMDKKTVAAVLGVPAFLLGVGDFNREEYNNFVQTKVRAIAETLQQEMTRCLIINPRWYIRLNYWRLMDYDVKNLSDVLLAGSDRGFVNGDEWRTKMHLPPAGLKEYRVLENYIPWDKAGDQAKLNGGEE